MKLILVALFGIVMVAGCVSDIPFLSKEPPSFMSKCTIDSDCTTATSVGSCCSICKDVAINKKYSAEWEYANMKYCQTKNQTCSVSICDHGSKALCISEKCVINKTVG